MSTATVYEARRTRATRAEIGRRLAAIQQHANDIWATCLVARAAGDEEGWAAGHAALELVGQMMDQVIAGDIETVRKMIAEAES